MDQVKEIFAAVDEDGSGSLSKEEFVSAAKNDIIKKKFSEVMRKLRYSKFFNKKNGIQGKNTTNLHYIPIEFEDMLHFLSQNIKRKALLGDISKTTNRSMINVQK
mmetsp:Transcript_8939/g.7941  ORF Transcript_8939/g.7941 Transcript_8939/m.7941 type:complete len:105 (-) Transcript_8939:737-1051(-)